MHCIYLYSAFHIHAPQRFNHIDKYKCCKSFPLSYLPNFPHLPHPGVGRHTNDIYHTNTSMEIGVSPTGIGEVIEATDVGFRGIVIFISGSVAGTRFGVVYTISKSNTFGGRLVCKVRTNICLPVMWCDVTNTLKLNKRNDPGFNQNTGMYDLTLFIL